MIKEYVREEVLHREAKALGLAKDDYIIKKRMVQKLDFITKAFIEQSISVQTDTLKNYYNTVKQNHFVEPTITFTHVFVDFKKHKQQDAKKIANAKLDELNTSKALFSDAPRHGDRFLYHVNYVERTPDYITSHFGNSISKKLFAKAFSKDTWHGPYESTYGMHIIMVSKKQEGYLPTFSKIKKRIQQDYLIAQKKKKQELIIQDIIGSYNVQIKL